MKTASFGPYPINRGCVTIMQIPMEKAHLAPLVVAESRGDVSSIRAMTEFSSSQLQATGGAGPPFSQIRPSRVSGLTSGGACTENATPPLEAPQRGSDYSPFSRRPPQTHADGSTRCIVDTEYSVGRAALSMHGPTSARVGVERAASVGKGRPRHAQGRRSMIVRSVW